MVEWWPKAFQTQGVADGGKAALKQLYDMGTQCFDVGAHPWSFAERPSEVDSWVDNLLRDDPSVNSDIAKMGLWEELACMCSTPDFEI